MRAPPAQLSENGIGAQIADRMDAGTRVECRVNEVTGDEINGANIELAYWDGPIEEQPAEPYFAAPVRQAGCVGMAVAAVVGITLLA